MKVNQVVKIIGRRLEAPAVLVGCKGVVVDAEYGSCFVLVTTPYKGNYLWGYADEDLLALSDEFGIEL